MYIQKTLDHQDEINLIIEQAASDLYEEQKILYTFGQKGRIYTLRDFQRHFVNLDTAEKLEAPELFYDYVKWLHNVLTSRNIEIEVIISGFQILRKRMQQSALPMSIVESYDSMLSHSVHLLKTEYNG